MTTQPTQGYMMHTLRKRVRKIRYVIAWWISDNFDPTRQPRNAKGTR